jgi:hypothetical protein
VDTLAAKVMAALAGTSVLAAIVVAVVVLSDGGSQGSEGQPADEIAHKVVQAIGQPGKVYFADGSDGSLAWIDAERQLYRGQDSILEGGGKAVGSGWTEFRYDPGTNSVSEQDTNPGGRRPRIDDPMVRWMDPLAALAFSDELRVVGHETAEGVEVIVIEGSTPFRDSSGAVAQTLYGRIEIDASTYLPHAFQPRTLLAGTATPTPGPEGLNARVTYDSQFFERSELPADFFDRSAIEAEIKTNQTEMNAIRELGLTPFWFGEYYDGSPYGEVQLAPSPAVSVDVDAEDGAAAIRYALVSPTSVARDAVIIRLAGEANDLTRPQIPQFAGDLPENREDVVLADGTAATLYTSILTVDALPCATGNCPSSSARLYRRLVLVRDGTAVQIEVSPRVLEDGTDSNGFNSPEGIIHLAGALTEVPPELTGEGEP